MSCNYGPNGFLPNDALHTKAVKSSTFIGCTGKFNTLETNTGTVNTELRVFEVIDRSNPKYYGAVGDGVTDDSAAFQAALDAVSCVHLDGGNYLLANTITIPQGKALQGCSPRKGFVTTTATPGIVMEGASSLKNLKLSYTGANLTTSTLIQTAANCLIENVHSSITQFNAAYAVLIDSTTTPVSLLQILNCALRARVAVIRAIGTQTSNIIVANNLLIIRPTATPPLVVDLTGVTNSLFVGNTVSAQTEVGATTPAVGIQIGASCNTCTFNNVFVSVTTHYTVGSGVHIFQDDLETVTTLAANVTTFSSANLKHFVTANAAPTTLANITGGYTGKAILVRINDANTTVDFSGGGNLRGNAGVNWTPTTGDFFTAIYNGTNWLCTVVDTTV